MSTPKEVLFFKEIKRELEARDHKVVVTTRKYRETNDLLSYFGITAHVLGWHGETRKEKLEASIFRMNELFHLFKDQKIDGLITLVNPETCRVAFGLGIPVYNFIDMIESKIVCKLTLPLSKVVFIPFHVPRWNLHQYWRGDTYIYNCLDPAAWMPKKPASLQNIGLEAKYFEDSGDLRHPFILYRLAETKASYFEGEKDITGDLVEALKKDLPEATFYQVARYKSHRIIDLQSLLAYVDLFIGGGGTITEEACWWGTWSVTCRPFLSSYDQWLINTGLLSHIKNVKQGIETCKNLLSNRGKNPKKEAMRSQVFPLREICDVLEAGGIHEAIFER